MPPHEEPKVVEKKDKKEEKIQKKSISVETSLEQRQSVSSQFDALNDNLERPFQWRESQDRLVKKQRNQPSNTSPKIDEQAGKMGPFYQKYFNKL